MCELILHHTRTLTDVKRFYKIFINKSHKYQELECGEIYSSIRSISKSLSSNIACICCFFEDLVTKHLLMPEKAGNTIKKYVWSVFINSNKDNDSLIEKENIPGTEKNIKKMEKKMNNIQRFNLKKRNPRCILSLQQKKSQRRF